MEESPEAENLSEQLDRLIAKYEASDGDEASKEALALTPERFETLEPSQPSRPSCSASRWLQDFVLLCEAVREKLLLLPSDLDMSTARLAVALAATDLGAGLKELREDFPLDFPESESEELHWLYGDASIFQFLSTADACWGLCCQQKLLVDILFPRSKRAPWSWQSFRLCGVAWWLEMPLLDQLITRLAQASTAKLRCASTTWTQKKNDVWGVAPAEQETFARRLAVDEAVFWSVLLGATVSRLKALVRTGLFREEKTKESTKLAQLFEHPKAQAAQSDTNGDGSNGFLRKNAFRCLELHRFHLAAALFLLSGSCAEACQVVQRHLKDLQLCVLVARKRNDLEVLRSTMQNTLQNQNHCCHNDPWLRFLLAWHAGTKMEAVNAANAAAANADAAAAAAGVGLPTEAAGPSAETFPLLTAFSSLFRGWALRQLPTCFCRKLFAVRSCSNSP